MFPEVDQSVLESIAASSHAEDLSRGCPWNRRRRRAFEKMGVYVHLFNGKTEKGRVWTKRLFSVGVW